MARAAKRRKEDVAGDPVPPDPVAQEAPKRSARQTRRAVKSSDSKDNVKQEGQQAELTEADTTADRPRGRRVSTKGRPRKVKEEAVSPERPAKKPTKRPTHRKQKTSGGDTADTEVGSGKKAQNGKRRQSVKAETTSPDGQRAHETPRIQLKREQSDSAEVALRKIAQNMNDDGSTSDSDSSVEMQNPTRATVKEEEASDSDEMFEDVDLSAREAASAKFDKVEDEEDAGELQLTLEKAERLQLAKTGKTKQSARAVHERCFCHYMSTIAMVAIGAWRNVWINDPQLHKALRKIVKLRAPMIHKELQFSAKNAKRGDFVELMGRIMKLFDSWFKRTKVGLRKLGHRPVSQMDATTELETFAESFQDSDAFVEQAKSMSGSRDFGAQIFTALLRAYHFKVRLIFSTQPLGFKFNEREEFSQETYKSVLEAAQRPPETDPDEAIPISTTSRKRTSSVIDLDTSTNSSSVKKMKRSKRKKESEAKSGSKDDAITLDDESDLSEVDTIDYVSDPDLLSDLDANDPDLTIPPTIAKEVDHRPDSDLAYPIFWTEIYDNDKQRWIAVDAMVKKAVFVDEKGFKSLHPRGAKAEQQKLTLGFVVAYDANKYAKDVTMRYASSWAKVKEVFLRADGKSNTRYDVNKILVRMSNPYRDEQERREDEGLAFKEYKRPPPSEMPKNLADFKSSPKFILDKHLREKEAFKPGSKAVDTFTHGKGSKELTSKVFLRKDVVPCKTIENYHKEGRKIKAGERPMKMIKARAMTTNRIREHQQQMAETGEEHVMQGIYSIDQTEYIIPPPIKNGVIPKNAYGNADVFVESMIPAGATHLKLKGAARLARKLEIDHAEAVVGFEFKKRGAIPLVLGVLVADENAARLEAAWQEAEELRIRKEDKKRSDAALKAWVRFLKGLRIRQRIHAEYGIKEADGDADGTMNVPEPPVQKTLLEQREQKTGDDDAFKDDRNGSDDMPEDSDQGAGGFIRE